MRIEGDIPRNFFARLWSYTVASLASLASFSLGQHDSASGSAADAGQNPAGQNGAEQNAGQKEGSDADAHDIAQFQSGKVVGFNRLVLRHKDRVHTLCFRLLGRGEDALDAAQEVFVRVYQGLPRFRGEAKFTTWLHTIALNTCRNRQVSVAGRMAARSAPMVSDESGEETLAARVQGGDIDWRVESLEGAGQESRSNPPQGPKVEWSSGSPDHDLVRKRREALLQKALVTLPFDMRQALVLRDIDGRSYEDIAALTHWEMGTVRSRIHRAREKLREILKDSWE
jgi:RNA polymerase sigma-70 factor, ECF subfamily